MTTTPEVPHPHLTTPDENGRLWAFRAVHPDFRSRDGYVWPFPGKVAKAAGPFDLDNKQGCPSAPGDGICLGLTWRGVASGSIPAITVLVCSYLPADLLGTEDNGSKVRVKKCRVERVVDFPATLRRATPLDDLLPSANLYGANLTGANLRSANLRSADLRSAYLRSADLRSAYLRSANLTGANLYGADLTGANLRSANLHSANLRSANLTGADLTGADLHGARGDSCTQMPAGYSVPAFGLVVRDGAK